MAKKKKQEESFGSITRFNRISPVSNAILVIVMVLLAVICLYPVLLMVAVSFTDQSSIYAKGYSLFPTKWSLQAYKSVMQLGAGLWKAYGVTIFRTIVGTLFSLFVMSQYAFVLAQKNFNCKKFYTYYIFFTMIFGAGMIPCYIVNVRYLHLDDTIWILILPGALTPSNVIILRTFITSTIPEALFESARIDGASNFRVFLQIVLPLFKPGLATIGLFSVVSRWNEWFIGIMYINKNKDLTPVQTVLQRIQANMEYLKEQANAGALTPDQMEAYKRLPTESFRMAITVIATLPILFAYPFFQRYFIEGLTIGSVKG